VAKNVICFENGVEHEFSEGEMAILKESIKRSYEECFTGNKCSEDVEFAKSLENLYSLFVEHLD